MVMNNDDDKEKNQTCLASLPHPPDILTKTKFSFCFPENWKLVTWTDFFKRWNMDNILTKE